MYIAPIFAKSGRQNFVIQPGEDHSSIELYKTIVDFRQEEVPISGQIAVKKENVRIFKKPVSVFAKWHTDTDKIKDKCLYDHDFLNWKLERFVKDADHRNKVEKSIDENFYMLKAMFLEMASETLFPLVS